MQLSETMEFIERHWKAACQILRLKANKGTISLIIGTNDGYFEFGEKRFPLNTKNRLEKSVMTLTEFLEIEGLLQSIETDGVIKYFITPFGKKWLEECERIASGLQKPRKGHTYGIHAQVS